MRQSFVIQRPVGLSLAESCVITGPQPKEKGVWTTVPALDLQFVYDYRSELTVRKFQGVLLR